MVRLYRDHVAVRGHVEWHKPNGHFLRSRFGFSFEPDLLSDIVQASRIPNVGAASANLSFEERYGSSAVSDNH